MKRDRNAADQERLISDNQGLVVFLAKSFNPNDTDLDDYIQVGSIGLWKAASKFDPNRGSAFTTLAWYCIRNEIIRYIKKEQRYKDKRCSDEYSNWMISNEQTPMKVNLFESFPDSLTDTERSIVDLRLQGHTFVEIGDKIGGMSKGGASNLFKNALKKIRIANSYV